MNMSIGSFNLLTFNKGGAVFRNGLRLIWDNPITYCMGGLAENA